MHRGKRWNLVGVDHSKAILTDDKLCMNIIDAVAFWVLLYINMHPSRKSLLIIQFSWGQGPFSHTNMPVISDEHLKIERKIGSILEILVFFSVLARIIIKCKDCSLLF